jgi:D-glycero-D-manno-heptose 1,7-bisphosphate phosphatase
MNRALFLDRDGVLDELVFYPSPGEWESPRHVRDLKMRDGVEDALKEASRAGWLLFIITNQPSYAKGKCPLEDLQEVHRRVLDELKSAGVIITADYICYHHPESKIEGFRTCQCRKPSPFFIREAAKTYDVDLRRSWMVGDQDSDVVTGVNAGCRTALLNYGRSADKRGKTKPDLFCADLADFVHKLEAL